jgi:hypothetical protein
MISIIVERTNGNPIKFDGEGTPEEFKRLCNGLEEIATNEGYDPKAIAGKAIHMIATQGEPPKIETVRRGQQAWAVYAVIRYAEENVDLANMVAQAGVITGPPTIFDLASHQHIEAEMRILDNKIQVKLNGSSPLDS